MMEEKAAKDLSLSGASSGEVLVQFCQATDASAAAEFGRVQQMILVEKVNSTLASFQLKGDVDLEHKIALLQSDARVCGAQENYIYETQ